MNILVLNPGSSSLKFQLLDVHDASAIDVVMKGIVDRIGSPQVKLSVSKGTLKSADASRVDSLGHATELILNSISDHSIDVIGYRVVHGGYKFDRATRLSSEVRNEIDSLRELSPLHNAGALQCIDAVMRLRPNVPSIAVFDTGFHRTMPDVARLYAIPREFADRNHLYRYGFHGISHQYVSSRLIERLQHRRDARVTGEAVDRLLRTSDATRSTGVPPVHATRLVTCHLGNGSSVCAILNDQSVDTSMGLTPLEGLVMGTRSGDIDAGLILHLIRELHMSADQIDDLLNHRSGMLGLSGRSSDVRDLEQAANGGDAAAELALESFAYRCRKYIGAYAAALGGVDAIAFAGGIGEHSPSMRARIVRGLEFLGVELDDAANSSARGETSIGSGRVGVWLIPTDEERQIAKEVFDLQNP